MIVAIAQWATMRFRSASAEHGVLVKNSVALAFGTGATGVLGFVYWWLAARSFSPEVIGTASAFISLIGFVGVLGECGLGMLLMGEVMRRPKQRYGLISAATIVCVSVSLAIGGVSLVLSGFASGSLNPSLFDNLWVFIGCGLTGFAALIDYAFIGMLHSGFRMARQLIFSVLKLAFIMVVAKFISSEVAILISWVASLIASIIIIDLVIRRWGLSLFHRPDFKLLYELRYSAGHHYLLDLGITAPNVIMPYLVAVLLSPASNAVFTMLWLIISVGTIIPGALSTVLFPVVRAAPEQYCDKMKFSFVVSMAFAFGFGCLIFFYSTEILALFNQNFAVIAGSQLRFLGFGMVGTIIKSHVCSAARINDRMRQNSFLFGIGCVFELGSVAIGCHLGGLEGLSIGWTCATLIEGAVMMLLRNPFHSYHHVESAGLALKD